MPDVFDQIHSESSGSHPPSSYGDIFEKIHAEHGGHAPDWHDDAKNSAKFLANEVRGVGEGVMNSIPGVAPSAPPEHFDSSELNEIRSRLKSGNSPIWETLKNQFTSGDMEGLARTIGHVAGNVVAVKAAGDLSEAAPKISEAASDVGETTGAVLKGAGKGAYEANKNLGVHGAAGVASIIPGVGHAVATGIEGANTIAGALKGAKAGLSDLANARAAEAAQVLSDARVAASRASTPIYKAAPSAPAPYPPVQPIPPAYATSRSTMPAMKPAETPVPAPAPVEAPPVAPAPPRIPIWQRIVQPKSLADFARGAKPEADLPAVPSYMQEAFEGDRGGTGIPQEQQARTSIVNALAPKLIQHGIKPEDLDTAEGRAQAAKIAEGIPGLSKNKEFIKSIKEYNPSDTTLDRVQTLMEQWGKFADKFGYKSLGDFKQ